MVSGCGNRRMSASCLPAIASAKAGQKVLFLRIFAAISQSVSAGIAQYRLVSPSKNKKRAGGCAKFTHP
jgi:hypothetical protein